MTGRCPIRSDYESEREYQDALEAFEVAEYWSVEQANERYYGE